MSAQVIYNDGAATACRCRDHRPIRPVALRRRLVGLWVRDQIERRHLDHFMPEVGCPPCFASEEARHGDR